MIIQKSVKAVKMALNVCTVPGCGRAAVFPFIQCAEHLHTSGGRVQRTHTVYDRHDVSMRGHRV